MLYGGLFIRAPLGDSKNNGSYPCYTYDGERSDQPPITYRWKPLLSCRHWTDHCIIRNRPQSLSHTLTWDTPKQLSPSFVDHGASEEYVCRIN